MDQHLPVAKTSEQNALAEFVPIHGEVHLVTDFGVFLQVQNRRVFVAVLCMQPPDRVPQPGEAVTLHVSRAYAKHEGLVA